MSLRSSITEELQRTPVAAISAAIGVVVASLSLGLAWLQYQASTAPTASPGSAGYSAQPTELVLGNVMLIVAYFLAVTIAIALFIRVLGRKHDITAFFVSIPLVALGNFSAILVIYLAPPRALSQQLFSSAHDLVFYASAAIVIAFCGRAVLRDFGETIIKEPASETVAKQKSADGIGVLLIVLLLLAIWSWLVFAGQTRLTRTLLPEATHPVQSQVSKVGA